MNEVEVRGFGMVGLRKMRAGKWRLGGLEFRRVDQFLGRV
jgi:hypothetical protein